MNGLPYYKAYPRDFIEGTIGMDFETKAAYRLVLDLIYMQGGKLPDDARYISGLLGCTVKKWIGLRNRLVALGKIDVRGSHLGNNRADKELETLGKLQRKQRENRSVSSKNNDLPEPRFDHTEPDTDKKETTSVVSTVHTTSAGAQVDFDGLSQKLEKAGNGKIQPHSLLVVGPIVELMAAGASLDLDVLPTVRQVSGRLSRVVSLSYFLGPIREAYERRVSAGRGLTPPKPLDESEFAWAKRIKFARERREWSTPEWGPAPGKPGCRVPAHLLTVGDGDGWTEFQNRSAA